MKNYKKILYLIIFPFFFTTFSCEDEDKINAMQFLENAQIVTMQISTSDININPSSPEPFLAEVDANNVNNYSLSVTRVSGNVTSDPILFNSYTSFPFSLQISKADLANTFSIEVDDILVDDEFNFIGTSTGKNGAVYTIDNFNGNIINTSELEFNSIGYEFTVKIINQ
ncbi:MAG: hypothetical protein L3J23_00365 [Flavobacteriaceae bacterium]|nr:hypothetical protein [Flavobacteriaceae bacterium]